MSAFIAALGGEVGPRKEFPFLDLWGLKLGSWRGGLTVGLAGAIEFEEFLIPGQQCAVALVRSQGARLLGGPNGLGEAAGFSQSGG